jgi:ribosomal protein S18 acetylase RimI-like enzyme
MMEQRMTLAYRSVTRADIPDAARVHQQAHWETYAPIFGADTRALEYNAVVSTWSQAIAAGATAIMACDQDTAVGVALAEHDRIAAIYILSTHQRQRIGRHLLEAVLQSASGQGYPIVRFEVLALNAAAIAFYRSQGACEVGRGASDDSPNDVFFQLRTSHVPRTTLTPAMPDGSIGRCGKRP